MPPPAPLRRHFLGWERPLPAQAAAWLAANWTGGGPLDLSQVLVIVPTRQSGRRLREALAEHAAARGAAVFPPRVQTSDALLAEGANQLGVASRLEALLAWTEVLQEIELAEVPEVLPVAPPRRDFSWAWRLAESFHRLQTQLTEAGLAFADVAPRAGENFPESARWRQLAALEQRQVKKLAALGRREPHAARRDFARQAPPPAEFTRLVVLGAPDPLPLALVLLERWAEERPVDLVVFAPESEAATFDAWGRPLTDVWEKRVLELPDIARHVQLCADPSAQAERAAAVAQGYAPAPDGLVALGTADPEVLPLLENALSRVGLAGYNPEGRVERGQGLHALLAALGALAREDSFDAVASLARCPDFLAALVARGGRSISTGRWLAALDAVRTEHLPPDLAEAQRAARESPVAELHAGLELVAELRAQLRQGAFPHNVIAALALVFRERRFDLRREEEARAAESAAAWRKVMGECAAAAALFPGLSSTDWWDVALRLFGEVRQTEDKPPGALDLQGWLELLWEDAPHLVVAGVNDGLVPDAIVGDAFLPETLRVTLGLKTNAARFARDAYLLQAIVALRRGPSARVDLLFGKNSAAGEPLRPSRLLLRCPDADLPARIARLFRPVQAVRPNLPWTRAWQLAPRRVAPPARVSVTGLRTWLACPFRFYLAQVLRMEPVDPTKAELDARDFGTLCHAALEGMATAPAMRDCADEQVLRELLLQRFEHAARERFGEELTLPLVVQLESARQRLAKAAAVHARDRAAGWVVQRAEWKFTLDLGGLEVGGKIDRIDRHEQSGAWRVLDYKTTDMAPPPHKAHLRPARVGDERLPAWMRVTLGGREHVWADLQLPLYLRAIAAEARGDGGVSSGYFNLPKAVGETAIVLWHELDADLQAAAAACADGVAAAIRAGEFWPPAEITPERDPFAALFHHGAEESVAWTGAARP